MLFFNPFFIKCNESKIVTVNFTGVVVKSIKITKMNVSAIVFVLKVLKILLFYPKTKYIIYFQLA